MKKIDNSTMGGRIKEQRIKMGMTQEQLAEILCTTKPLILQYENNKVDIKGSVIMELAKILDTTTGYLLNNKVGVEGMDEQVKEMVELFRGLGDDKLRRVGLEQVKLLLYLNK